MLSKMFSSPEKLKSKTPYEVTNLSVSRDSSGDKIVEDDAFFFAEEHVPLKL